ncbi:MAG TPA: hypothetical protein VEC36_07290, partial [Patescibacteria group bacterium]|nr:hypothetical protein [Patescibacteria group bacterium]
MKVGKTLSAIVLLCALMIPLKAQKWEKLAGIPYTGAVTNVAVNDEGTLYVTADHVLYYSNDEGRNWISMFEDGEFFGMLTDVATYPGKPKALFFGSDWAMYSTMDGQNWRSQTFEVNSHTGMGGGVGTIVIDPKSGNILPAPYVVRPNGVWQRAVPGKILYNYTLLQDGSIVAMEGDYSKQGALYKSTNGGISWVKFSTMPTGRGKLFKDKGGKLYAFLERYENSEFTRDQVVSTDNGATWEQFTVSSDGLPQNAQPEILTIDPVTNYAYAELRMKEAPSVGLYVSKDGMKTWSLLHEGLRNVKVYEMMFIGDKIFMATQQQGVLLYHEKTQTIEARNNGLMSRNHLPVLVAANNDIFAYDHEGIRHTRDGKKWQSVLINGKSLAAYTMLETSNGALIVGSLAIKGKGEVMYRSLDGGVSWTAIGHNIISEHANWTRISKMEEDKSGKLYALTENSADTLIKLPLFVSTDGGMTWNHIFKDSRPDNEMVGVDFLLTPSGMFVTGFTMGLEQRIYFSADGGKTWSKKTFPTNIGGAVTPKLRTSQDGTLYTVIHNKAYRSTDNAATWTELTMPEIPHDFYFDKLNRMYFVFKNDIYNYNIQTGILRSADGGITFENISEGLPNGEDDGIATMAFTSRNTPVITLFTGRIYRLSEVVSGVVDETRVQHTAYPNP